MRDSGFSLNNYVKKGKKKLISFWRVGGLLLTVIDANIGYRREHDMSEREYSGFGIFNLKFTIFFSFNTDVYEYNCWFYEINN